MANNPFESLEASIKDVQNELKEIKNKIGGSISNSSLEYFKLSEIMEILKISKTTARKIISDGELNAVKRGKRIYVSKSELESYLNLRD